MSLFKTIAISGATALFTTFIPAHAATLEVHFTNLKVQKGTICVSLHQGEDKFNSGDDLIGQTINVTDETVIALFGGLEDGDYGLKIFHDINDNGKMDTNAIGIPSEPFAFSNNAKGRMGPPNYEKAKFVISGEDVEQTIRFGR